MKKQNENYGSGRVQKKSTRNGEQQNGCGGGMTLGVAGETAAQRLRRRVESREILVAPGAQDAFSARLVERAGFDAVFCGDYNAAAVLLGKPDYGFINLSEMVELLQRITRWFRFL